MNAEVEEKEGAEQPYPLLVPVTCDELDRLGFDTKKLDRRKPHGLFLTKRDCLRGRKRWFANDYPDPEGNWSLDTVRKWKHMHDTVFNSLEALQKDVVALTDGLKATEEYRIEFRDKNRELETELNTQRVLKSQLNDFEKRYGKYNFWKTNKKLGRIQRIIKSVFGI